MDHLLLKEVPRNCPTKDKTMTRTRNNILVTALTGVMALSLGACSSSQTPSPSSECDGETCDTPSGTANSICQIQCNGEDDEEEFAVTAEQGLDDLLDQYIAKDDESLLAIFETFLPLRQDRVQLEAASICIEDCRMARAEGLCEERRNDAITQVAFERDYFRWACADVRGVTKTEDGDDRGQEYCEYYAALQLPDDSKAITLGRNLSRGGQTPAQATWGADSFIGKERLEELTSDPDADPIDVADEISFELEDAVAAAGNPVVGQCIFTTWHADVNQDLPVCVDGRCPTVTFDTTDLEGQSVTRDTGIPLDQEFMQMKVGFNSNLAASDLVTRCIENPQSIAQFADLFVRGCMGAFDLFETEWRRSDSEVCVISTRLRECGCKAELFDEKGEVVGEITDPEQLGFAVVPRQFDEDGDPLEEVTLRGFQLGTWGENGNGIKNLPENCRQVKTGDKFPPRIGATEGADMKNIVACDIKADKFISESTPVEGQPGKFKHPDLKETCRATYGNDVVVHVPVPRPGSESEYLVIPNARIVCENETCGDEPWVIRDDDTRWTGRD